MVGLWLYISGVFGIASYTEYIRASSMASMHEAFRLSSWEPKYQIIVSVCPGYHRPRIVVDQISIRPESAGSMSNRRRYEGGCYLGRRRTPPPYTLKNSAFIDIFWQHVIDTLWTALMQKQQHRQTPGYIGWKVNASCLLLWTRGILLISLWQRYHNKAVRSMSCDAFGDDKAVGDMRCKLAGRMTQTALMWMKYDCCFEDSILAVQWRNMGAIASQINGNSLFNSLFTRIKRKKNKAT